MLSRPDERGHFGTFGRFHGSVLAPTVERILDGDAGATMLLVGRNGPTLREAIVARRPELARRPLRIRAC